MKRSKTSKAWMMEHVHDTYVSRAQTDGYRSRAAYKLLEIDDRDKLIKPGMTIVDLGAAPGSWSQVVCQRLGDKGVLFALDILDMPLLPGIQFLRGDFTDDVVLARFEAMLGKRQVDLVLSDIAPNMTGVSVSDDARGIYLAELVLEFAANHLRPGGKMLVKVFQGASFEAYRKQMQTYFTKIIIRKPKASRDRSAEVYLLGVDKLP